MSFGKIEIVADVGAGKTIVNGLPNDNFALSGRKPPAFDQLGAGTQREARRHQAANRHVHFAGPILARQNHDNHPFTGGERFSLAVLGDAGQRLQCRKKTGVEASRKFCHGTRAHNENVHGIAAGHEGLLQAGQQRHQENRGGHGERNAQSGHDGEALAQLQIANVIADRNRHSVSLLALVLLLVCRGYPM